MCVVRGYMGAWVVCIQSVVPLPMGVWSGCVWCVGMGVVRVCSSSGRVRGVWIGNDYPPPLPTQCLPHREGLGVWGDYVCGY